MGKAGKIVRLVRVMRIMRIFKLVRHFAGLQSLIYTLNQVRTSPSILENVFLFEVGYAMTYEPFIFVQNLIRLTRLMKLTSHLGWLVSF